MRVYKNLTLITGAVSTVSLIISILLNYLCPNSDFWINVSLAIFGSALLTALTALITYFYEKRKTLEGFMYGTLRIIGFINKYEVDFSLDKKVQFFIDYYDLEKDTWDAYFGDMDFFLEKITGNREYIYANIYSPIRAFGNAVAEHIWHFRWHLNGTGKNDTVMKLFVEELEDYLIEKRETKVPTAYDENNNPTSFTTFSEVSSKMVKSLYKELYGRYYTIMYGKHQANKLTEEQDDGEA